MKLTLLIDKKLVTLAGKSLSPDQSVCTTAAAARRRDYIGREVAAFLTGMDTGRLKTLTIQFKDLT